MKTATVKDTWAKVRHSPMMKIAKQQTFEEWLVEEANAGRMILAAGDDNTPLPAKPQETADFWDAYHETRLGEGLTR